MRKLTDYDLISIVGSTIEGYCIEAARVKRGTFTDSDHYGFLLGRNTEGSCVTWQFHLLEDGAVTVYWGHYDLEDYESAIEDYNNRGMDSTPKKFQVTITETLKRTVEVEAGDQQEAERIVSADWRLGGYILDASDFTEVAFDAVPIGNEWEEH